MKVKANNNNGYISRILSYMKQINWKDIFPYLGFFTALIFFEAMTGRIFTKTNFKALLGDGFYIMIGAVGYIFIIAQGNLDFSIGGTMAVCCATAALASSINPYLSAPAAILIGMLIGSINGFFVAVLKIDSFIATMAFNYVLKGCVVILLKGGVLEVPSFMLSWDSNAIKITTLLSVVFIGFIVFNYTTYGKHCRAVGSCQETAMQTGVNTKRTKFIAFVTMSCLAGLLGFFSLLRTGTASSQTGKEFLTNAWNAVLLGGVPVDGGSTTKFRGAIIGSMTMALLSDGMTLMGLSVYAKQFVRGVIFIIIIAISFNRKNLAVIK
jgi:ribose transport system permease protein